ncbi:MAG: TetR/AcrR family transcriptional regulator [Actinobacteria bacterium]|nr:TetR/AcrR family transcriptional regulator [Actinomycetota bacterium]
MPRIETETLAQHRDWRRNQLIDAAASIAMESGGAAVTVAAVAQRAGLSRTSVYEYFGSGSELVADLVIDELHSFAETLNIAVAECTDAPCIVTCWVKGALTYIADGRHLLAKALNATAVPQSRAQQIGTAHRALMAPLVKAVTDLGVKDTQRALSFIQAITDASTKRIESGHNAQDEIAYATTFCINGLMSSSLLSCNN